MMQKRRRTPPKITTRVTKHQPDFRQWRTTEGTQPVTPGTTPIGEVPWWKQSQPGYHPTGTPPLTSRTKAEKRFNRNKQQVLRKTGKPPAVTEPEPLAEPRPT